MKLILVTSFVLVCNLLQAQTSIFNLTTNSTLKYSGESENDKIEINISKPTFGNTASYSFTDNISYHKKGKVVVAAKDVKSALRMATLPEMIVKESEKFSNIGSAIWMSASKFDSVIKYNIYIDYDVVEENGKQIVWNTTYRAKRVRQSVIVNGKATLIEAIKLTSDTLQAQGIKGVLEFTIQNNKNNPILLYSSSKVFSDFDGKHKEEIVFELWLKIGKILKLVN